MKVEIQTRKNSAGVIEAASIVVGSLKSKLTTDTKRIRTDSRTFRRRKRST